MPSIRVASRALRSLLPMVLAIAALAMLAGDAGAQCGPCGKFIPDPDCAKASSGAIDPGPCTGTCRPDPSKKGNLCRGEPGNICNPAAYCNAAGICPIVFPPDEGTVCRPSEGACDVAETCQPVPGSELKKYCPADGMKPAGATCRTAAGSCDVAETCDGSSVDCPADGVQSAGSVCRAAAGACDVAESCDGASAACPADSLRSAGAVCRGASGPCDTAEACSGASASCPADSFQGAGTVCRGSAGVCDVAEVCSGSSASCPADAFKTRATVCRGLAGACDVAESCSGSSAECPADAFRSADDICRDSIGQCDPQENCTGASAQCPGNVIAAAGTACAPDRDACTLDACDGGGRCAHTTADADDDGTCDALDPCTNVAGARDFLTSPKSTTAFAKVGTQVEPGDDGLTLRASFDLPPQTRFSDLAPDVRGARLIVSDPGGEPLVDVTLATGAYGGRGTRGWTRSKSGKAWTFVDKTGEPANGIIKLKIADKSGKRAPHRASVALTGKDGIYPVHAGDLPLAASITLGNQADAAAGLCAESTYATEDCTANRAGDRIACTR